MPAHPCVRMPAEWEPHTACLILYPHNPSVFRSSCQPARDQVIEVAKAITTHGNEDVVLFCKNDDEAEDLRVSFARDAADTTSRIVVMVCPSDDSWARDTGPTFVIEDRRLIGIDWDFNAYGGPESGCYWPCERDKEVASKMCQALSSHDQPIERRKVPMVLEGGSIHTDGEGTILTTKECLLNPNRNPGMTQQEIENEVLTALGCKKVIWLPLGLAADEDTNGHVDNMACFVKAGHVLLSWTDNEENDPDNYRRCRMALDVLDFETDARGRKLKTHKLYLPPPLYYTDEDVNSLSIQDGSAPRTTGDRLASSYANFYIANDAVIVPQFGQEPWDSHALKTLEGLFPGRKVLGVLSREILLGGGNIHCITQQMPKAL